MTDRNSVLAPCPFCGCAEIKWLGYLSNSLLRCTGCGTTSDDGSHERVHAAWNRRTPAEPVLPSEASTSIALIEKMRDDYIREYCQTFNDGHWVGTDAQQEHVSTLDDIVERLRRVRAAVVADEEQDKPSSVCTTSDSRGREQAGMREALERLLNAPWLVTIGPDGTTRNEVVIARTALSSFTEGK